jgi:hypothetical protein
VDQESRIFAVLAGRPNDPAWDAVHRAVADLLEAERAKANLEHDDIRNTEPLSAGISYGGGQTVSSGDFEDMLWFANHAHPQGPMQKAHSEKQNQAVIDRLLADPNMQRVAGFQSSTFPVRARRHVH